MILKFDKNKYPLDHEWHEWIDNGDNNYNYYNDIIFNITYNIFCTKCGLNIIHQELNKNYEEYELIKLYDKDMFFIIVKNEIVESYDLSEINYKSILSCSEMIIKKLLE